MMPGRRRGTPVGGITPALALVMALALTAGPICPGAFARLARAPVGPPLVSPGRQAEPEEAGSSATQVDPLVANGLGSPTCSSPTALELDPAGRRDCQTSGFLASAAPTQDYGLDVHIDTGLLGLGSGELLDVVQDLFVAPVWMALVWAVHALLVMLEWSLSLNLIEEGLAGGLQTLLSGMLAGFTGPWLPLALSAAAVLTAYHGLVRRRVAQSLGEALLALAMMTVGIWLIVDPLGTIGALGRWSGQAALGTLAVAVRGTPVSPGRALGESFGDLFAATIEAPWCYLEFGDVDWCRGPARLDPALRAAGLRIAARESSEAGCSGGCGSSASARALAMSARLLREARTNAALFLALPPNGPDRNSINDSGSLLRTLCASSEATDCQGPFAAQAEFRTGGGTWSRVGGLLLICLGLAGMLALVGTIALRLLLSALLSVLYLLLAPAVVIAPALGEPGRTLFRVWLGRLLGAVLSKLLYAFLLGAVLAVMSLLEGMSSVGWWTRWLLLSALWWGAFLRRRTVLGFIADPARREARQGRLTPARATMRAAEAIRARRERRETASRDVPTRAGPDLPAPAGRPPASFPDGLAQRCVETQDRPRGRLEQSGLIALTRRRVEAAEQQLLRIRSARELAGSTGERRRGLRLRAREERVSERLRADRELLRRMGVDQKARRAGDARATAWSRYLDEQAALPRGTAPGARDYPGLAGLAGLGRDQYERLDRGRRRAARQEIDRALAARREQSRGSTPRSASAEERARQGDERAPHPREDRTGRAPEHPRRQRPAWEESEVINDIREVAAGRKRQLGIGRP